MARPKKKKAQPQQKTSFAPRKAQSKPIWAIVFFAIGALYLTALYDFEPSQSELVMAGGDVSQNIAGTLGAMAAGHSIYILGISAWMIPIFMLWTSTLLLFKKAQRVRIRLFLAFLACLVSGTGIARLVDTKIISDSPPVEASDSREIAETAPDSQYPAFDRDSIYFNGIGGLLGELVVHEKIEEKIGIGTALYVIIIFITGFILLATDNIGRTIEEFQLKRAAKRDQKTDHRQKAVQSVPIKKTAKAEPEPQPEPLPEEEPPAPKPPTTKKPILGKSERPAPRKTPLKKGQSILEEPEEPPLDVIEEVKKAPNRPEKEEKKKGTLFSLPKRKKKEDTPEEEAPAPLPTKKSASKGTGGLTIFASERTEKVKVDIPSKRGNYEFPPLTLLALPEGNEQSSNAEDHQETADALIQTLDEFGVKVSPSEVHTGPVITRYEITPAPGVRVEKILNLDKNIALGLRAEAVRILAPVPGKGTVGIEVPNRNPSPVCMREIIESKAWAKSKAEIPVVLGKDVTGKPIVEDLTKMPHMLIAGSTGSGKTVCINAIIASLLYHAGPDDLRFIMVDPKVVEMQIYNALPHMLIPVVTDPKKVPGALKYLINEMERRYQIFAKVGVRNIAGFNAKIAKDKEEKAKAAEHEAELDAEMSAEERVAASVEVPRDVELEIPEKKLHYIVCIIDELADLMMVAPQDIETGVARIAQLARAAGIHLILATQRPSVNVITGVIKANLPTRISFKVASKVDSRTILDGGGAEALIGKGDMLFVPPGTSNLVRAQGAFVSDDEINQIVEFLQKNGPPEFAEDIQQQIESGGEGGGGAADNTYEDELVPDAIGVLKASKRASTSMLQRRLKIGYNRAARIMEILEDEGIVGPENGSSPREILKDLDVL